MAKKSRPTFKKREKEKARVQKQQGKEARRLETKELKANTVRVFGDEDPDIAGIRPGPQPLPEQWLYAGNDLAITEEEATK
ncbi:MAG: hypothetical protein HY231_01515 [Acidobacteria bacterium]|nr:hypothetical protein [Acidobacteriota bacterium]